MLEGAPLLAPAFARELAAYNPLGEDVEPEDVQSWYEMVYPELRARGYKPPYRRVLASWWRRISSDELERARARRLRKAERAEERELERLAKGIDGLADELEERGEQRAAVARGRFRVISGG